MEPDPDFILHITADQLKEVKFGPMGKVAFYFKDSKQFFAKMCIRDRYTYSFLSFRCIGYERRCFLGLKSRICPSIT